MSAEKIDTVRMKSTDKVVDTSKQNSDLVANLQDLNPDILLSKLYSSIITRGIADHEDCPPEEMKQILLLEHRVERTFPALAEVLRGAQEWTYMGDNLKAMSPDTRDGFCDGVAVGLATIVAYALEDRVIPKKSILD